MIKLCVFRIKLNPDMSLYPVNIKAQRRALNKGCGHLQQRTQGMAQPRHSLEASGRLQFPL